MRVFSEYGAARDCFLDPQTGQTLRRSRTRLRRWPYTSPSGRWAADRREGEGFSVGHPINGWLWRDTDGTLSEVWFSADLKHMAVSTEDRVSIIRADLQPIARLERAVEHTVALSPGGALAPGSQ